MPAQAMAAPQNVTVRGENLSASIEATGAKQCERRVEPQNNNRIASQKTTISEIYR